MQYTSDPVGRAGPIFSAMVFIAAALGVWSPVLAAPKLELSAERLPDLPDPIGLASPFVGTSGQALIVAGGTNFPDKKPWEGGVKRWHDEIYVLESPEGKWINAGKLPRPMAYGASISTAEGLVCIGGYDAERAYTDAYILVWREGRLERRDLPPLPTPVTSAGAAMVGQTIYLAGGTAVPDVLAADSLHSFLALDLSVAEPKWQELPTWPGPERYFPVAAAHDGTFYLFTGMRREMDEQGKPKIGFLTDAYAYTATPGGPAGSWRRLADLPRAKGAAPSPASAADSHRLAILGGGVQASDIVGPMSDRRGLSGLVLMYDIESNRWTEAGEVPAPRCATTAVSWRNGTVVPSGEVTAGVRSPQVWFYRWTPAP